MDSANGDAKAARTSRTDRASLPPRTALPSIAQAGSIVADRGNKRIQVFAPDGKFVAEWTGFGNPFGALVVGNELLVSDGDANTISHLSLSDGKMVKQWGNARLLKLPHLMASRCRQKLVRGGSERQAHPALRSRPLICVITDTFGGLVFRPAISLRLRFPCSLLRASRFAGSGAAHREGARIASEAEDESIQHRRIADTADCLVAPGESRLRARSASQFHRRAYLRPDREGSDPACVARAPMKSLPAAHGSMRPGRIPPVADLTAFLRDKDPKKRDKLIDRLVDSEDFVNRWSYYFEDLFRAGNRMGFGANLFHYWIEEWLTA